MISSVTVALAGALLSLQTPAAPPTPPAPAPQALPWYRVIGARVLEAQAKLPVLDQVVLVPDAATYLDEISHWTLRARWPVLIEDDSFAPRFIRAFKPSAVFRRPAVAGPAPAGAELRAKIEAAVTLAWEGDPAAGMDAAFVAHRLVPAGVVGASTSDPAWTAAVALAAGRGQLLAWIDGDFGVLSTQLDDAQFNKLDSAVTAAFKGSGISWNALGDSLETFTLCRNTAFRANIPKPAGGWSSRLPPRDSGPLAVTDALCRNPDGTRFAFAAQIPGDSQRAAYAAMCSLFLVRNSFWMFDGYFDRTESMFTQYDFSKFTHAMVEQGFVCDVHEGSNATVTAWKSVLHNGVDADVLLVNSAGNADFFQLGKTDILWSSAVPILNRPAALSMIHSFSLQMPDQAETLGFRWLDHGVYAYTGSVHEPYVVAFVPPRVLMERMFSMTPFLIAGRQWEGDIIPQAWRIATVGDPLMTIAPPAIMKQMPPRKPAAAPVAPAAGYLELHEVARSAMEATRTSTDGAPYARAMRALVLLGDDRVAAQLFGIASAKGQGAAVAGDALGALYRMHDRAGFMKAWSLTQAPSSEERDMLWALWSGGLGNSPDREVVSALKKAVRTPRADMDAELLLPALKRVEGRESAAAWLDQLIAAEPSANGKHKLAELHGKI